LARIICEIIAQAADEDSFGILEMHASARLVVCKGTAVRRVWVLGWGSFIV
jgi:hypothetical protein